MATITIKVDTALMQAAIDNVRGALDEYVEADRNHVCAFALALALLTWLHGSQAPDVRAELDAWMRAGIDGAKVKP